MEIKTLDKSSIRIFPHPTKMERKKNLEGRIYKGKTQVHQPLAAASKKSNFYAATHRTDTQTQENLFA